MSLVNNWIKQFCKNLSIESYNNVTRYMNIKYCCKDISQLNLQTMKMVMFSSFNFSWNLSSDVSARCSSHPQGENDG